MKFYKPFILFPLAFSSCSSAFAIALCLSFIVFVASAVLLGISLDDKRE